MTVRSAASRLVTLATLVAIATALVGTTTAQARSGAAGARPAWHAQDHGRGASGASSARQVDVHRLPAAKGVASPQNPHLGAPARQFRTAAPTGTSVAVAPTFATTNTDPVIGEAKSFAGLAQTSGAFTSGEPPDPWVAAGPEHVAQVVNTAFRFTNRSGGAASIRDMFLFFGLDKFYAPGEVAFFDPHIVYDSLHQRWIAIEASFDCFPVTGFSTVGTGYVDIAISSGPNPTGTWFVDSISFADALPDYPGIGTSTDKVVASSNVFEIVAAANPMGCAPSDAGDAFLGTEMDVMAWSELLANKVDPDFLFSPNNFPNNYFSWRPSLQTPASTPTVLAVALTTSNGAIAYARITGSPAGSGTVSISISSLASLVTGFSNPPPPQQPGAPATIDDAVDARPTDAIFKDNRLALVSTATCDPAGGVAEQRDCVRVTELNTTNQASPTLIQTFFVGEEGADLYMGGIGYASNDDLHVVWTRSSAAAGQYPSSYAAYQSAGAANNTLSARALLSAGTGTYPGHRWGDYVGVAQDPQVPNAVWQANEFSAGADFWATEVSQLQTAGSSYVPITPVRVLDTRPPNEIGLTGVFTANLPRSFAVGGTPGIPANAVAVTGNVTVVGQTAAGFVAITPTPVANPTSSTLNFPLGDTRANNFTTPLSGSGKLAALYKSSAGKSTHLLVDITGYFLAGDTHATYATVTPKRVLDTRPGTPIGPSGLLVPSVPRTLTIAGANTIPPDATAITANLTVTGQTAPGFLSVTPDPDADPKTSTLNFPLADTRANGATFPLNGAGKLSIVYKTTVATGRTHVLLDVTGFYRNVSTGLKFFPLTPGRIMDTRPGVQLSGLTGTFKTSTPRQLPTAGHWGVPSTANAITGNLTVVSQTAPGFVSATLTSIPNPPVSVLNFPLNDIRANGATLPLNGSGGAFFVYNSSLAGKSTNLILDVSGYFD